jgi:N-acyl-phosphatidylethanolamine-hydrolysing phospholipase D
MMMRFKNPHVARLRRSLFDVLLWQIGFYDDRGDAPPIPEAFSYPRVDRPFCKSKSSITWINHSTFLIQMEGIYLLTDPIWSERCSPFKFFGPKRHHPTPFPLSQLPKIDYVLISHDHYDHLDAKTVDRLVVLFPEIVWLVPLGVKEWFIKRGIHRVIERGWWEEAALKWGEFPQPEGRVTAVPAQHFSGRRGYDLNRTLWAGWVVEYAGKRLYFAGDTGYNTHDFKAIGERWGSMDLSLIPIGSYCPRTFMAPVHIEPKDAVRIHQEVRSKLSIGMHWKTFHLSDELPTQPPYDLLFALQQQGIDPTQFLVLEPGETVNW